MNKLLVKYISNAQSHAAYPDCIIKSVCEELLQQLAIIEDNEEPLQIVTGQELVLYMFRALLFKEYKHLQSQVTFIFDGVEVKFDHRMRTAEDNYPHSLFDECLCILLGAEDD